MLIFVSLCSLAYLSYINVTTGLNACVPNWDTSSLEINSEKETVAFAFSRADQSESGRNEEAVRETRGEFGQAETREGCAEIFFFLK